MTGPVPETIVNTGANRGIGLEFTRRYLEAGAQVVAGCRAPAQAVDLNALAPAHPDRLHILQLDVTRDESIADFAAKIAHERVDVLINNAGVLGGRRQSADDLDFDEWMHTLRVNTVAPLQVALALRPRLQRADRPRIITLSSQMGALSRPSRGSLAYRSSKAAVNKAMQGLALELEAEGVVCCLVHPGWVRTDMGGPAADLSVEESVEGMLRLIEGLSMSDSGRFFRWDGTEHPW